MSTLRLLGSLSVVCSLFCSAFVACSSSSDGPGVDGNTSAAGSGGEATNQAGAPGAGGTSGSAGTSAGGTNSSSAGEPNAGGAAPMSEGGAEPGAGGSPSTDVTVKPGSGPCAFSADGQRSFPSGSVLYICTNNSRIFQSNGSGKFEVLVGAAIALDSGDSSTLGFSVSSDVAPQAGDTWVLNNLDHKGNASLNYSSGGSSDLWSATSSPAVGEVTIKFGTLTLTHGTNKPTDVYYLGDITFSGHMKGLTDTSKEESFTGTYQFKMVPNGA